MVAGGPEHAIGARELSERLGAWQHTRPAYQALADGIRQLVLDGRIPPGTRIPAERDLSQALRTSRTTVTSAYAVLRERGFLTSRRGSGSRVTIPTSDVGVPTPAVTPSLDESVLDLVCTAPGAPAGTATAVQQAAEALPAYLGGHGYQPLGLYHLRERIAERYAARGLPTEPDQILVTAGAMQAIVLLLRAYVSPGDRVLIEHPTYANAIDAFRRSSARLVLTPLPPEGWDTADIDRVRSTITQAAPRMAYLMPDFQNPTGQLLDTDARERIASTLTRTKTLTVVDETLVDIDLDGPLDGAEPPPPMASYDARDLFLTIGSASKAMWGGLRIGWIRAPLSLVPSLLDARASFDIGASIFDQLTTDALFGRYDELLADRRAELSSRRAALTAALAEHRPRWRFRTPRGGMVLWCEMDRPIATALAVSLDRVGVRVGPGPRFGCDGTFERFLRLPYTLPENQLTEAVRRIAAVDDQLDAAHRPDRHTLAADVVLA